MDIARRLAIGIPQVRRLRDGRDALLRERDDLSRRLAESEGRPTSDSPFFHYNAAFDPQEVIRRHAAPHLQAVPEYLTNFLGVKIDPKFYPPLLEGRAGQVEGIPIPANWHADIAEWGAALRAVDLARGTFTVIELGCGWGCWMNNTGVAARRAGLAVNLIGVEGDQAHLTFAQEACAANAFGPDQVTLRRGIVAPTSGIALFPREETGGIHYGLLPVFGATEEQRRSAVQSGRYDELPMIALDELTAPHVRIDLLHIDIQGGEADFIAGCLPTLSAKVAYLLVGTHSRQIEGRIMDTLFDAGWTLEIERPAIFSLHTEGPQLILRVDGVQGWRNPGFSVG
ncbi:MAG TPA: FkbM family methyltransferase [Rhodopila sp.]